MLTATDATQYAWEGDQVIGDAQNSVFTLYLLQGLRSGEADTDGDGKITLDELYDYVYEHVVTATPKQTPGKWSYKQQGEIVIANNPRPVIQKVELPVELNQAIESPFSSVREGVVRELEHLLRGKNQGLALAAQEALRRMAEDDSRRVANLATQVLASYEPQSKESRAQEEADSRARAQAEAERAARQIAEQERLARERAEAERAARQQAEQERLANERAEAERAARQKVNVETAQAVEAKLAAPVSESVWQSTLLTAIGWGIAYLIYVIASDTSLRKHYGESTELDLVGILEWMSKETFSAYVLKWALIGVLVGGVIGLVLQRRDSTIQKKQLFLVAIGWGIAYTIGVGFVGAIIASTSEGILDTIAWIVANVVSGMLGGLFSGLALQPKYPTLQREALLIMAFGWGMASAISWVVVSSILSGRLHKVMEAFLLFGGVAGLIAGAIGSAVMFWQLQQLRRKP